MNIRNPEIHKAVDMIRVGDAERHRRLIRGRPATKVQNHPDIRKLKVRRRVAVAQAQNASAEDLFVVASRSLDVGDGEKLRDADPLTRGHLIALLFDLYGVHGWLLSIQCSLQIRHSESRSLARNFAQMARPLSQKKMGCAIGRWYCPYFRIDCGVSCLRHMAFHAARPEGRSVKETLPSQPIRWYRRYHCPIVSLPSLWFNCNRSRCTLISLQTFL